MSDIWWTAPTEAENGNTILVTGRDDVDRFRASGKHVYRVEVTWRYDGGGMPGRAEAELMEQATDALQAALRRDKVAVMTGIYTGDGQRDWVFYTKSLPVFNTILNRALADLPALPIVIEAYSDPDWAEYSEMRSATYIPPSDDD